MYLELTAIYESKPLPENDLKWKDLLELMLALLILIVVARRVSSLHTLRVLGGVRKGQELLLELGGHIDAC